MFWVLQRKKILPVTSNRYAYTHLLLPGPRHTASSGVTEFISSDTSPFKQVSNSVRAISSLEKLQLLLFSAEPQQISPADMSQHHMPRNMNHGDHVADLHGSMEGQLRPSRTYHLAIHCWHSGSSCRFSSSTSCLPWTRRAGSTVPWLPCTLHGIVSRGYWAGRNRTAQAKPCTSSLSLSSPNQYG